jgi:hypothetical protein
MDCKSREKKLIATKKKSLFGCQLSAISRQQFGIKLIADS